GVTSCAAAALAAAIADPRQWTGTQEPLSRADAYVIDDRLLVRPSADSPAAENGRETPGSLPRSPRIAGPVRGAVLLKLGHHLAAERILPWGARVRPLAGDIQGLASHMFATLDDGFATRARDAGQGWVVAGRALGMGPRREEIALVAVALGVRGMMARS